MEESTTPATEEQTPQAAPEMINGVQVDGDGFAIPATDEPVTDAPVPAESEEAAEVTTTETPAEPVTEPVAASLPDDTRQWIENQGLNPDDPATAGILAKRLKDTQSKLHERSQETSELRKLVQPSDSTPSLVNPALAGDPVIADMATKMNELQLQNQVNSFYLSNPDAVKYDGKLAELILQKPYLINDLSTALRLVKADELESEVASARQTGQQEERARLAQASRASLPATAATTQGRDSDEITPQNVDAKVAAMSDEEYEKRLPEIQAALR